MMYKKAPFKSKWGFCFQGFILIISSFSWSKSSLVWPASVSPFSLHLISLAKEKESDTAKKAEDIYAKLTSAGVEVLFDDRNESAGAKFADSDLIGIPMRVVVSDKSILAGGVEIKERTKDGSEIVSIEELFATYKKNCE